MPKDDITWLNIAYVVFALLLAYVFWQAINTVGIQTGWEERYDQWFPLFKSISAIVAAVMGAIILRSKKDRHEYLLATVGELRKVSWPSMIDTRRMTVIVCVVVGIFAVILMLFDLVWTYLLNLVMA